MNSGDLCVKIKYRSQGDSPLGRDLALHVANPDSNPTSHMEYHWVWLPTKKIKKIKDNSEIRPHRSKSEQYYI